MSFETQRIYDEVCAPYTLSEVLSRQVSIPIIPQTSPEKEGRKTDDTDTLMQLNIRVKASIAQSFRSFCAERNLSQSDGLRLLLLGEDFKTREPVMQSYLREINSKNTEIACLEEKNKELTDLQNCKETWVLHQRKEWIKIAKQMIGYLIDYSDLSSPDLGTRCKPHSIKSNEGYRLFSCHQYPSVSGCHEVIINGLVRGFSRAKQNAEQYAPLFICGTLLEDNTPVKYRWYAKKDYIGVPPFNWDLTCLDDRWLLCCIIAKDGAADLVSAVPMRRFSHLSSSTPQSNDIPLDLQIDRQTSRLDSLIAAAQNRHK